MEGRQSLPPHLLFAPNIFWLLLILLKIIQLIEFFMEISNVFIIFIREIDNKKLQAFKIIFPI